MPIFGRAIINVETEEAGIARTMKKCSTVCKLSWVYSLR